MKLAWISLFMLTKLVVTLLVVVVCLWIVSVNRGGNQPRVLKVDSQKDQQRKQMLRRGAYGFMLVMVLAAVIMIYIQTADQYTQVTVHVVNTQTGARTSYRARRENIDAKRFTTIGGREIFVAAIERIEVEDP